MPLAVRTGLARSLGTRTWRWNVVKKKEINDKIGPLSPTIHRGLEGPQVLNSLFVCSLQIFSFFIVQYSIVQYSTVQYSAVQYSTVQYSTVQYITVQYITRIIYFVMANIYELLISQCTVFLWTGWSGYTAITGIWLLYCIVMYCIVLYCIVIYCIVLYCTML